MCAGREAIQRRLQGHRAEKSAAELDQEFRKLANHAFGPIGPASRRDGRLERYSAFPGEYRDAVARRPRRCSPRRWSRAAMHTLKQDGIPKVLDGITDIHDVRAACV